MSGIFQFKQFSVDQSGCAMKINTDGVLLGAIAAEDNPGRILDVGTGTGVIALMLAQRFVNAEIDAVEIDISAAETAAKNFKSSAFSERLHIFPNGIETFFDEHPDYKYDLIISNPPFYINSLESPKAKKTLAKHTDADFFEGLIKNIAEHLSLKGLCWLILPVQTATLIKDLAMQNDLYPQKTIVIRSFENSEPHRAIVCFGFKDVLPQTANFTIYEAEGIYSDEYKTLLQPYFLNF
ncbi:tRNA1(Val) (adenine(37)-N6)-methyltransferase [Mucilaginibacter sp. OK098]|uniref:tRNA1(Val) (adenine(37)-N6)-methyltransferase n=1 Tax=Mucilaginibacter sp. OK098 TaxID=1855297 RepID=UPI000911B0DB|nr:methyltransferase [Mucilaginibacter sp. OK098]SHM94419.1 tRNA1Val (adenine37-N6)-methyltransferase [Mucilaginibacter sp. OK098]